MISTSGPHEVRNGEQILRFEGTPVAAATSRWDGAPRWTEMTVYRLKSGYLMAKIGRSLVAHTPSCSKAQPWRMRTWLEGGEEARVQRVPCIECQPAVGDRMDPHTLLETTRYSGIRVMGPATLMTSLLRGRVGDRSNMMAEIVHEIIRQLRQNDPAFEQWWVSNNHITHADERG